MPLKGKEGLYQAREHTGEAQAAGGCEQAYAVRRTRHDLMVRDVGVRLFYVDWPETAKLILEGARDHVGQLDPAMGVERQRDAWLAP